MSRCFGLATLWCEHHPEHAPLPRHKSNGTRPQIHTLDGVTLTRRRVLLVFCKCWLRRVTALIENLREASRHDVAPCCRDKAGCSLQCGAQSRLLVELFGNSLPNGSGAFSLTRWQTPQQDVARCCHGTSDVVSCLVCIGN